MYLLFAFVGYVVDTGGIVIDNSCILMGERWFLVV